MSTPERIKIKTDLEGRPGYDALWLWFGISRASFLTMPRVLMHEMPDEWQGRMAALLNEYDATFDFHGSPEIGGSTVRLTGPNGKLIRTPPWLLDYRHPDRERIGRVRAR